MSTKNYDSNQTDGDGNSTLSMIDCGIKSLRDIAVKYNLTSVNLHSNFITKIENLIYLQSLAHLDLSSNRITKISGLNGLVSLKSLNLSCNALSSIENLDGLKQLTYMNLSYNKIQYVNGLNDLWGRDYHIETILLNSNFLSSIEEVSYYLSGLIRLKHISLNDNKFLKHVEYRPYLLTHLKNLVSLDGRDRANKKVNYKANLHLDEYNEFINFQPSLNENSAKKISFHSNSASKVNNSKQMDEENNESTLSSLGPKLDVIEDKIHTLLKIRDKIKHSLSGEEDDDDDEDLYVYAKNKYDESSFKKLTSIKKKDKKPTKSILKSPISSKNTSFSENTVVAETSKSASQPTSTNSNVDELVRILQEQLNAYKQSQEEHLELIAKLKQALETNSQDKEKSLKEKDLDLSKEKDLNKLLIKDLEELKAKFQQTESKLKHVETKASKFLMHKEDKLKSLHSAEAAALKCKYEMLQKESGDKINQLEVKYKDLEDEFRSALLIESTRFNELFRKYEHVSGEFNVIKTNAVLSEQTVTRNESLIKELNELVKEQKFKIQQLSKIRKDANEDVQKRNVKLNEAVSDCVKFKAHCEELKRQKRLIEVAFKKLSLESENLQAEKNSWLSKLNEQKNFFMQENGRLEVENKQMRNELDGLTANFNKEHDQCKIKTKVIEDQTETIKKLKSALVERDEMLKKSREESLQAQKSLEKQLNGEMDLCNELQLKLEKAGERKEALKVELEKCRINLDDTKSAYDELVEKWKQKSELITELEVKVKEMKENFEHKEREMAKKEKELADANNEMMIRLKRCDDSFRVQFDAEKKGNLQRLEALKQEYEAKLVDADCKVKDIEDEMRIVLIESEKKKKFYEEKINSFSQMFSKFQADIKQDR